jgi:hypothetical protein
MAFINADNGLLQKRTNIIMKTSKSPGKNGKSDPRQMIVKAVAAEKQAEIARKEARLAKAKYKEARKAFKQAKRAAKQARKKARDAAKTYQPETKPARSSKGVKAKPL